MEALISGILTGLATLLVGMFDSAKVPPPREPPAIERQHTVDAPDHSEQTLSPRD